MGDRRFRTVRGRPLTGAYVHRPPYARVLDRVFRTGAFLGVGALAAVQALWPGGFSEPLDTAFDWYEASLYGALVLVGLVGAWATLRGQHMLETVVLPGAAGLLLAHACLVIAYQPVRPGLFAILSLAVLFLARLNFLLTLASAARANTADTN